MQSADELAKRYLYFELLQFARNFRAEWASAGRLRDAAELQIDDPNRFDGDITDRILTTMSQVEMRSEAQRLAGTPMADVLNWAFIRRIRLLLNAQDNDS